MNNIARFREQKWNLLIFHLFESVSGQSMGHLILVIEQNVDIIRLGDSKAKVMINNDSRSWEVEGRGNYCRKRQ